MINVDNLADAIVCKGEDDVFEVCEIFRDSKAKHIVVVDSETKPIGVISPSDIIDRAICEKKDLKKAKASDIMTKDPKCLDFDCKMDQIDENIFATEAHSLPVTKNGKLVGIIELWQLINIIANNKK